MASASPPASQEGIVQIYAPDPRELLKLASPFLDQIPDANQCPPPFRRSARDVGMISGEIVLPCRQGASDVNSPLRR